MKSKIVPALLAVAGLSGAQAPEARQTVRDVLSNWRQTHITDDAQLGRIKGLGNRALPTLAEFLDDKDLGSFAQWAMTEIDSFGAAHYLLLDLPHQDPSLHREAFRNANRLIREYELFKVAGEPKPDPTKAPPRWPSNTKPYPYAKELHRVAVQLAFADETRDTQVEIVQTIGLTGTRRDIPLLKKMNERYGYLGWLCTAAEARLGDRKALDEISTELAKPTMPHPAEPEYTDHGTKIEPRPGAVVASREDGERMRTASWQAAFTMNRRFVPLLLAHVTDPPGQRHGDYADPSPSAVARDALSTMILGKEYSTYTAEDWKRWQETHRSGT